MIEQGPLTKQGSNDWDGIPSPDTSSEEMDIEPLELLFQLAYRKWLIAKVTGLAMFLGLALCYLLPVKYTATTKLLTPQQSPSSAALLSQLSASPGAGSLAALAGGGLSALKDPNALYVALLNSRPIADAIIQKFGLSQVYHAKNMSTARKRLAGNTEIVSDKAGFIVLSATDGDKKRAAEIANAYTDELRNLMKTLAFTEASQRRLFYEEQLKQAKEALVAAELSFLQVQQKKGMVQLDAQAKAMIESIAALRAKVAAKEVEVQSLRSYSTEQNPVLQLAERELSSLQAEVARMEQQNHSAGFGDMGFADVPGAGLDYLRAEHDLKYRQALFDLLQKQYEIARLDEAKEAVIIQVVEPAIEPEQKSSPRRAFLLLLSTFVGLIAGCVIALLSWWREHARANPDQTATWNALKSAFAGRKPERI
jgi:uncharacterized protein involved in exopolysaccharide biosynthesis